ncbi:ABC transporter substrate-binding protein [Cohnella hongkongensis]|uniref:ABC transporter substrate-binding protein n=1 Tax=Cohnella hongkongensis TaxID=178337 RepID=A0ABV9FL94_9BACL
MKKGLGKSSYFALLVLLLFALTLTACSGNNGGSAADGGSPSPSSPSSASASGQPDDNKPVKLRITPQMFTPTEDKTPTEGTPVPRVALDKIIADFTAENPHITVEILKAPTSSQEEYLTWMTTKIASGDAPEITWATDTPQNMVGKGWLLPIDDYLDQPNPYVDANTKWLDTFTNAEIIQKHSDGKRYTVPIMQAAGDSTAFFYNIDIFEELNLAVPNTWGELVSSLNTIKDAGYIPIIPSVENKGPTLWQMNQVSVPIMTHNFVEEFNYTGAATPGDMVGDEWVRAIRKGIVSQDKPEIQEVWRQYKAFAATWPEGWATQDMKPLWQQGKAAVREGGMWELSSELSDTKRTFRWGMFSKPFIGSDSTPLAPDYEKQKGFPINTQAMFNLAIVKPSVEKSDSTAAAVKFLQYLTKADVNEYLVNEIPAGRPTVKGAATLALFDGIKDAESPVLPEINFGMNVWFDSEANDAVRRNVTNWIANKMDDNTFFSNIEKAFQTGADQVIASQKLDTSKW